MFCLSQLLEEIADGRIDPAPSPVSSRDSEASIVFLVSLCASHLEKIWTLLMRLAALVK